MAATLSSFAASAQQALSLHDAIQAALRSPTARIADDEVNVVRGQVRQAELRPSPKLYLQSEDLRPWADNFSFADNTEDYAYIGQSFELDHKRAKRVALAHANLARSQAERSLRLQQITGNVAAAYWTTLATERIVLLLRQDLSDIEQMVSYHRERVDAGAMRGVDLIRMQIERDRVSLALGSAERDASLARIDLCRQIGMPATGSTSVKLSDEISATQQITPVPVDLVLAQRAEISIAREELTAAEADLTLQHSLAVPDLDLLAGYKRNSGDNTIYTGLQLPLNFRSHNQGEIERAAAQVSIARAGVEQATLAVRADVEAAARSYQREQDIVQQTLPDMRARAKQNLQILSEAYRIGGIDLLRYIDAERTEIDVEVAALHTFAEYQQSILRLQLAYGRQP